MAADQNRPAAPKPAPDPSDAYERAHPENEAGMGRLDNNDSTPARRPDQPHEAVSNRQESRQINAHDVNEPRPKNDPDHSMADEEPLDQGPTDITNPRFRRHPRTEGKGGTP